ncbi:MAG: hypothetical protein P8Y53_18005 [Pseudolabrys sp.]
MRIFAVSLAAILCLCAVTSAQAAQRRMFIIGASADGGYRVDRCLARGAKCGKAAANAYCRGHHYAAATAYQKVNRDEITGAIPSDGSGGCRHGQCENLVAIVCTQ